MDRISFLKKLKVDLRTMYWRKNLSDRHNDCITIHRRVARQMLKMEKAYKKLLKERCSVKKEK